MAQKKIPAKPVKSGGSKGKNRNQKQPTQKTPMQRVAVMGPTGKLRFEWRPWA